jgi:hypothetical protein
MGRTHDDHKDDSLIEIITVPSWISEIAIEKTQEAELLILPRGVRDGRAEYRSTDLAVVKTLRAAGVKVDWAYPASERTFASEYSAHEAIAVSLFIVQSLGQEGVVLVARWLVAQVRHSVATHGRGRDRHPILVEVARLKINGASREIEGLGVTCTDERAVETVMSLLRGDPVQK